MTLSCPYRSSYFPLHLLIVIIGIPLSASAQTCSCAGAPLTNSLGIGAVSPRPWQVQLRYDRQDMKHLVEGNQVLEVGENQRQTKAALLQVTHAISPKWQVTAVMTWVQQEFQARNKLSSNGFGDMILLGQYRLLGKPGGLQGLYLGAGLTIPTGGTEKMADGILLGPDLQPGTGAWDALFSVLYIRSGLWNAKSGLQASATYRVTSEADRFQNNQTYQFGPEILFQASLYQQFLLGNQSITPNLLMRFRHTRHDQIDGRRAFNTGGVWLNMGGGMSWGLRDWLSLQAQLFMPIYRDLEGVQLTSSSRVNLGIVLQLPSTTSSAPAFPEASQ